MKQVKWIVEDTIIFANFLLIAAVGFWAGSILLFVGLASYAVVFYIWAAHPQQPPNADGPRSPH
jgi:hypothetical protein